MHFWETKEIHLFTLLRYFPYCGLKSNWQDVKSMPVYIYIPLFLWYSLKFAASRKENTICFSLLLPPWLLCELEILEVLADIFESVSEFCWKRGFVYVSLSLGLRRRGDPAELLQPHPPGGCSCPVPHSSSDTWLAPPAFLFGIHSFFSACFRCIIQIQNPYGNDLPQSKSCPVTVLPFTFRCIIAPLAHLELCL